MRRSSIAAVVVTIALVTVLGTFLFGRYVLTPSVQQRIVEQQSRPIATAVP